MASGLGLGNMSSGCNTGSVGRRGWRCIQDGAILTGEARRQACAEWHAYMRVHLRVKDLRVIIQIRHVTEHALDVRWCLQTALMFGGALLACELV